MEIDKFNDIIDYNDSLEHNLYRILISPAFATNKFSKTELGEQMTVINETLCGYWKPRYLLNHSTKCAYEFMDALERLQGVSDDDINWNSLKDLDYGCIGVVNRRSAHFPSFIRCFSNGVAEVQWQLQPDGYNTRSA